MKNAVLAVVLAIMTIGCFARRPLSVIFPELGVSELSHQIINPPRPHGKFKWLFVVRHIGGREHVHFLYADKYKIVREPDGWTWLVPEGKNEVFEEFYPGDFQPPRPRATALIDDSFILIEYPDSEPVVFLRSPAPE